jgi:DNA-directed RNA polymerase specialized sigma24 family protein
MSETSAAALRQELVGQYDDLKRALTRRLGSEDLAKEVLQETYLRLEQPARIGPVISPKRYLLTIAVNLARMSFRRERRSANLADLDAVLGFVDETPGPAQIVEARRRSKHCSAPSKISPRGAARSFSPPASKANISLISRRNWEYPSVSWKRN